MEPETDFLRQITLELASESNLEDLLDLILEYANNLVPFSSVNVCLLEAGRLRVVRIKGYEGTDLDIPEIERMYEESSIPDLSEMQRHPEPVLVRKSDRPSDWIEFEKAKWIGAFLGLPIPANGRMIGLIGFDSDKEDAFTNEDIEKLRPFAAAAGIALEKARLIHELEDAVKEKDVLMMELNHRVKNNLAIISSLIGLMEAGPECREQLSGLERRIDSIRIVHEKLYHTGAVSEIEFRDYIDDLLRTIFSFFTDRTIRIDNQITPVHLPTRLVVSLGLLVNELAVNAVKYAFVTPGEHRFFIDLVRTGQNGELELIVSNTGELIPESVDLENPKTLGLKIVRVMSNQIKAALTVTRTPETRFSIIFRVQGRKKG
jgi:two-component sensor histidine kinase